MAQDRALAEDQQAAGHDVGAFDRDRDRRRLPATAGEVAWPEDDALAAEHVHHVARHLARHRRAVVLGDRRRSEEHTSELQSLMRISYAVFCLKKKKNTTNPPHQS